MTDTDLAYASIEEIARLFRKRKLSPVELTKLILARIESLNPKLNAFITVTPELALRQAKRAETELFAPRGRQGHLDRGPLHGIPISLKDNIYTAGIRTTAGSRILKDFVPTQDATVVTQLKHAGVVILGKTNMHEFAYGITSENPHYGPVRNPWDLARISGGSSGGSAAAVAAGLSYGSIGTDTGGSIRVPSALCGVVGFKPMRGQLSDDEIIPLSPTLDCTGPIARSTPDAATLFHFAGLPGVPRHADWSSPERFKPPRKIRLGIPREFFFDVVSAEVRELFDEAIPIFHKIGAQTKEISIPSLYETEDAGNQIAWAEATHFHQQHGYFPARSSEYGEDVRYRLEMGTKVLATDYLKALGQRSLFIHQLTTIFLAEKLDALVVPGIPVPAPLIGQEKTVVAGKQIPTRALLLRQNRPANLANIPAISIPCGFTKSGLPVGLQLIGLHAQHLKLLNTARAFELAHPLTLRPPI
jgi:aspartyl-tRNA(Asn)/glutamyl-tRNA(Gln) amidotransferase subunit A